MNSKTKNGGLDVGVKSYLTAIFMILSLMILTYLLTLFVPGGRYPRILDAAGNSIIDPNGTFGYVEGGIPFWQWLLSPILALGADGGGMIIAILAFLVVIGGIFTCLQDCGLMNYMLGTIVSRFSKDRYKLLAIITLFFMSMGAVIGSFEECIPLVPIVTQLAVGLGWDVMTGLSMSLLAVGCGFASGLCNPFTVGIAQNLAGLPMYSGFWLRAVAFVRIYALLMAFLVRHAKSVDTKIITSYYTYYRQDPRKSKALFWFVSIIGVGMVLIFSSSSSFFSLASRSSISYSLLNVGSGDWYTMRGAESAGIWTTRIEVDVRAIPLSFRMRKWADSHSFSRLREWKCRSCD